MSHQFSGSEIVGVTGIYYADRNDVRFELSLATAENYRDDGLPYVVVNSSAEENAWVADAHAARGAIVLQADIPGIATQRQQGVLYAVNGGAEKVLSQEPEKTLMPKFAGIIGEGLEAHDVLVIGRTKQAEDSLPPVQQRTERLAGWILQQTHDLPHDTLSGGRGFTVAGAAVLADYPAAEPGMNNWLYLYETPLEARRRGLPVGGIDVDLIHPEQMVIEESGNPVFDRKRLDQFQLQLNRLLRLDDVRPQASTIAGIVLSEIEGVGPGTSNQEFMSRIAAIESELVVKGYEPAWPVRS